MHKRIQRLTTLALACALMLSLLPMAVPKAGAASTSTLSNVTESYVDASDGTQISKDETYSVTHKERTPQKIADYTYQDYSESVERVYSHKDISYIYGYPDKTVRPDRPMTRGEAAAVFYRLYDGQYPSAKRTMSPQTFSDLSTDLWCYKEIELLYSIGSIDGYGDGTFRPNASVTRAEFAALAARWAGLDYSNEPFPEKRTQKVKKKWNDSRGIRYRWLCSGAEKIILKTRGRNPTQSRVRAEGVVEDFQIGKDIALRRRSGWIVF